VQENFEPLEGVTNGEKVNVDIHEWMEKLEAQIKWTMKNVIRRCIIERDDTNLEEWMFK